jgi:hypothetical protein
MISTPTWLQRCRVAAVVLGLGLPAALSAQVVDAKFELFVTETRQAILFYEAVGFDVVHQKQPDGYATLQSRQTVVADPDGYYVRLSEGRAIPTR